MCDEELIAAILEELGYLEKRRKRTKKWILMKRKKSKGTLETPGEEKQK